MTDKNIVVLIPTLNPNEKLIEYVKELLRNGFRCIIINDGSSDDRKNIFYQLSQLNKCEVLHHMVNMGKGRALKDAFNYYLMKYSAEYKGVITADSDGQHTVEDILQLSSELNKYNNALLLGVRDFDSHDVPFKSRFGNRATRNIMSFLYGGSISDTQTGLRGIPNKLIYEFLTLFGERFEYETTMLIEALRTHIEIVEIRIATIYINDNSETHFRPLADSWAIYKLIFGTFFKYVFSSFSSALIDLLVFAFLTFIFKTQFYL